MRDEKVIPLELAVRKMTSFPAEAAALPDRGLVKVGFAADLVAFDLSKVKDLATYEEPRRYSPGFPYVAVNGVLVVDEGRITGAKPGKVMRGPGYARGNPLDSGEGDCMRRHRSPIRLAALLTLSLIGAIGAAPEVQKDAMKETVTKLETELVGKYGEGERARIHLGLTQASQFWRPGDGDAAAFEEVARTYFAGDAATREAFFKRMEFALESYDGHINEIGRDFRRQSDLDLGAIYPFDEILAGYDPSAHFSEDSFQNRLAFGVLLNFPVTTLADRLRDGESWSRRQWAEARLADRFSKRIPAEVNQAISQAAAESAQYIAEYNVWMHHVTDAKGARLFPAKMRLLSHWNLRDQLKSDYGDPKAGLAKQRQMAQVMQRIVTQTIPRSVVNNPGVDWDPFANTVRPAAVKDSEPAAVKAFAAVNDAEPDTRYAMLLKCFQAARQADPYSPTAPDADRPALRREPPDPGSARAPDARGGRDVAARAARREADRAAPPAQARALRRLVRRLQAARRAERGAARRDRQGALPDRRGVQEGHSEPPPGTRLLAGARARTSPATSRSIPPGAPGTPSGPRGAPTTRTCAPASRRTA